MFACEKIFNGLIFEYATAGFGYGVNGKLGVFAESSHRGFLNDVVDLFLREVRVIQKRDLSGFNQRVNLSGK